MTPDPSHPPFRSRRTVIVAAPPPALWSVLVDLAAYPRWWSWLQFTDAPGRLTANTVVRARISPPLPYALRLDIRVDGIDPDHRIDAVVTGDLAGSAAIVVAPHPLGSQATLTWDLRPERRLLRLLASAAPTILEWGHEWVVRTGSAQFARSTGIEVLGTPEPAATPRRRVWATAALVVGVLVGATVLTRRRRAPT